MGLLLKNMRKAKLQDLEDVVRLAESCFTNGIGDQRFNYKYARILLEMEPESLIVVENNGRVIGFAMLDSHEENHHGQKIGTLLWIAVSKRFRGKGIGITLFENSLNYFKSKGAISAIAITKYRNPIIHKILEKYGFVNKTILFSYILLDDFENWLNFLNKMFKPTDDKIDVRNVHSSNEIKYIFPLKFRGIEFPSETTSVNFYDKCYIENFMWPLEKGGFFILRNEKGNCVGFSISQTFWNSIEFGRNAWILSLVTQKDYFKRGCFLELLRGCLDYFKYKHVKCVSFVTPNSAEITDKYFINQKMGFQNYELFLWEGRVSVSSPFQHSGDEVA